MRNSQMLLKARPDGIPGPEHFEAQTVELPALRDGEMLTETVYISIDPAMRSWISAAGSYVPTVAIGAVMRAGGIARVLEGRAPGFAAGDLVQGRVNWQSHPILRGSQTQKLDLATGSAEDWIGPLGTSALTAYFGLRDIGGLRPGDRVLVSGAAGGVGQIAVQIAMLEGCQVVGIAGGAEKCAFLRTELQPHGVIDYKAEPDLAAAIGRECPDGVDLYFDNVGGPTLDAALMHLRMRGRVTLCGRISQTVATEPYAIRNLNMLSGRRGRMGGFIVFDYHDRYEEARAWLGYHLRAGRLRQRLHIVDGLDRAPEALGMLFRGGNTGKLVVRVTG